MRVLPSPTAATELSQIRESLTDVIHRLKKLEHAPAESTGHKRPLKVGDIVFLDFRGEFAELVIPEKYWERYKDSEPTVSMVALVDHIGSKQNLLIQCEIPQPPGEKETRVTVTGKVSLEKMPCSRRILASDINDLRVATWELQKAVEVPVARRNTPNSVR